MGSTRNILVSHATYDARRILGIVGLNDNFEDLQEGQPEPSGGNFPREMGVPEMVRLQLHFQGCEAVFFVPFPSLLVCQSVRSVCGTSSVRHGTEFVGSGTRWRAVDACQPLTHRLRPPTLHLWRIPLLLQDLKRVEQVQAMIDQGVVDPEPRHRQYLG